jgi:Domain of Unknown Function (DUF928)
MLGINYPTKVVVMFRMLPILGIFLCSSFVLMPGAIALDQTPEAYTPRNRPKPKNGRFTTTATRLYTPRKRSAPKGTITTTATRGCSVGEAGQGRFVALAPINNIGQTIATHPTFNWYIPAKTNYKLRFEIALADTEFESIIYTANLDSQPGLMQLTLPKSKAGLAIGQSYNWRVILQCETGRPSADQLVGGEIEVVSGNPTTSAQTYAESGLWYDAFAIANPQERHQLLRDLADLEAEDPADKILKQSEALQQIIELTPTAN